MKEKLWSFVKFWAKLDRIGSILLLIFIAGIIIAHVGIPEDVDEILPACVITENGEVLSCEVSLKGEITNYSFQKDQYGMDDYIKVWFGEQWLVEFEYYHGTFDYTIGSAYWSGDTVAGLMSRSRDVVVVELGVQTIFPEMESQRCVLIAPAQDEPTAMELLRQVSPEDLISALEWVKEIKG